MQALSKPIHPSSATGLDHEYVKITQSVEAWFALSLKTNDSDEVTIQILKNRDHQINPLQSIDVPYYFERVPENCHTAELNQEALFRVVVLNILIDFLKEKIDDGSLSYGEAKYANIATDRILIGHDLMKLQDLYLNPQTIPIPLRIFPLLTSEQVTFLEKNVVQAST